MHPMGGPRAESLTEALGPPAGGEMCLLPTDISFSTCLEEGRAREGR